MKGIIRFPRHGRPSSVAKPASPATRRPSISADRALTVEHALAVHQSEQDQQGSQEGQFVDEHQSLSLLGPKQEADRGHQHRVQDTLSYGHDNADIGDMNNGPPSPAAAHSPASASIDEAAIGEMVSEAVDGLTAARRELDHNNNQADNTRSVRPTSSGSQHETLGMDFTAAAAAAAAAAAVASVSATASQAAEDQTSRDLAMDSPEKDAEAVENVETVETVEAVENVEAAEAVENVVPTVAQVTSSSSQTPSTSTSTAAMARSSGYHQTLSFDSALAKRLAREPGLRLAHQRRPEQQLNLSRRSNVEALFAQISGAEVAAPCKNCHKGHGPWTSCVVVDGQLCGSCANCWFNASGARCSFHETKVPPAPHLQGHRSSMGPPLLGVGGSSMGPVDPGIVSASAAAAAAAVGAGSYPYAYQPHHNQQPQQPQQPQQTQQPQQSYQPAYQPQQLLGVVQHLMQNGTGLAQQVPATTPPPVPVAHSASTTQQAAAAAAAAAAAVQQLRDASPPLSSQPHGTPGVSGVGGVSGLGGLGGLSGLQLVTTLLGGTSGANTNPATPLLSFVVEQAMAEVRDADQRGRDLMVVEIAAKQLALALVRYTEGVAGQHDQQEQHEQNGLGKDANAETNKASDDAASDLAASASPIPEQ